MRSGQILQFPLARGLSEDGNPKAQPVSTLKTGHNIRWPRAGTIGKRLGSNVLARKDTGPRRRFVTRGPELCIADGRTLWAYDSRGAGDWTAHEGLPEVSLEWSTLIDDSRGVATSDLAIMGDLLIHAWVTGDPTRWPDAQPAILNDGRAFVQILNWRTGQAVLTTPVALPLNYLSNAVHVRILVIGLYALVLYSTTTGEIRCQPIAPATLSFGSMQVLATDLRIDLDPVEIVQGRFDALARAAGDVVVVYESYTSFVEMTSKRLTHSGGVLTSVASDAWSNEGNVRSISIAEDTAAGRIYVLYCANSDPTVPPRVYSVALRAIDSTSMVEVVARQFVHEHFFATQLAVTVPLTGVIWCFWSGVDSEEPTWPALVSAEFNGAAVEVVDTRRRSIWINLLARPFTLGDRTYVLACDAPYGNPGLPLFYSTGLEEPSNTSSYLLEVKREPQTKGQIPHRYAGKIDHDIAGAWTMGLAPQVAAVDASTVLLLAPYQATASPVSFNWREGIRLVRATIDPALMADPWRSVTIGREAYLTGAFLAAWDGRTVFDYGMRAPYIVSAVANATPNTGLMAPGDYLYQAGVSFRSRAGVEHRGPFSRTVLVFAIPAPIGSANVTLAPSSIDCKQTSATGFGGQSSGATMIDLYRSEVGPGAALYKLSYEPRYNVVVNEPNASTILFVDEASDAQMKVRITGGAEIPATAGVALASRPQPYTASEELEDCQPPASYTMLLHQGRLFLVTGSRREIWYSKDLKENPGIAPGFSPIQVELYEQDITALASMDEKRIVFTATGLMYVVGDGPTVSGTDNRFAPPQPIQSDVGCTNPRSVVAWPGGICFQSGTDIFNLSRGLEVTWFGKDARDTLAAHPLITSAVLVADQNELRFTCNTANGTTGIVLVFDYLRGTWSTRSYPGYNDAGVLGIAPIVDAVVHGGRYYLASAGEVRYEDTSTHLDVVEDAELVMTPTFVVSTIELESITPAGVIGWQRVRVARMLGESLSNHTLTMTVARDFATSYEQTEIFAAGSKVTLPDVHQRAELALTVQRRQAVQLKFSDAPPYNTGAYPLTNGAGFQLEGIALLVQPKPGLPRDTSARRGG